MTQFQFDVICKTLVKGVPALAEELINALDNFVKEYNDMKAKLEENSKEETKEGD